MKNLLSSATTNKLVKCLRNIKDLMHNAPVETPVPPGAVKFSHSARLGDLKVKICDADYDILNIHMSGFELDVLFRANERFVFRSFLSSLNVEHLSDVTLYPRVSSRFSFVELLVIISYRCYIRMKIKFMK